MLYNTREIIAHDISSPGGRLFSAAAKIFGINMEIQKGEPLKVEEGIDKRI